ncbi:hypothetical protein H8D29_03790 [PVC group bacterium]|nr:hypothetical protein [PVC group bacterium]
MKYRIWNNRISRIVEAGSMGDAWAAAKEDFPGTFEIERLDNWDCERIDEADTEMEKDLLIDDNDQGVSTGNI